MFNPSRDEVREFFCGTWRKSRDNAVLTPLESMAHEIILAHPEYHALLEAAEIEGEGRHFLHLSLHLALAEQLSIDQPPGIVARYRRLLEKTGSNHDALHRLMDCLGEMIWQAQRHGTPPDPAIYFACIDRD